MTIHSRHATQIAALDALGALIASGAVTEVMVYHTGIKQIGSEWCIVLRA